MKNLFFPGFMKQAQTPRGPLGRSRLYYVTNVTNLLGILTSGVIRLKSGWPKYAPDFQEATPEYIPLFVGGAPIDQLDEVTRHDPNDLPIVIEFNADSWSGNDMLGLDADGRYQPVSLSALPAGTQVLLIKGAVPLADVCRVYFGSAEAVTRFDSYCFTLANTRGDMLAREDSFSGVVNMTIELPPSDLIPAGEGEADYIAVMRRADAIGGILAALLRTSSDSGVSILSRMFPHWRIQSSKRNDGAENLPTEIVSIIESWIQSERRETDDPMGMLCSATLDFLVSRPVGQGLSPESLLDYIVKKAVHIPEKQRAVLNDRLQSIRASVLEDQNPQEFLKKGSPVLHGLLLFLLDTEYSDGRSLPRGCAPSVDALLIAEVMRGVLNGWSRLPVPMRGDQQAELAVGYAMAQQINRLPGSISLPERTFEWIDDEAELATILGEIVHVLTEKIDIAGLRHLINGKHVQGIELRIKAGPAKRGANREIVRAVKTTGKKTKKSVLHIMLNLPWK